MDGRQLRFLFPWVILCFVVFTRGGGAMVIIKGLDTRWFFGVEAAFGPRIGMQGATGKVYLSNPLDSCVPMRNDSFNETNNPIALVIRGGCTFDEKVMNAQMAGFGAVIVYDNEIDSELIIMSGDPAGIKIPSIFVDRAAGEILKEYSKLPDAQILIMRNYGITVELLFISVATSFCVGVCYLAWKIIYRLALPRDSVEQGVLSSLLVKAMPIEKFNLDLEENCTSSTCAICYADYENQDKLRVLPCRHKFHAGCIDEWLTKWRTFCPICKHDVRDEVKSPPASDSTPLLSNDRTASYSSL